MPEAWGAVSASSYDLRVWDDEAVAFVDATADTHHLSGDATAVLLALRAEPQALRPAQDWYTLLLAQAAAPGHADAAPEPDDGDGADAGRPVPLSDFESLLLGLERIGLARRGAP